MENENDMPMIDQVAIAVAQKITKKGSELDRLALALFIRDALHEYAGWDKLEKIDGGK